MKTEEAHQKLIDNVMDWFDFAKVAKMMQAVGFGWTETCEDFSEPVLREYVRDRICSDYERFVSMRSTRQVCESGGIRVTWETKEGETSLSVEAVLASWDADTTAEGLMDD